MFPTHTLAKHLKQFPAGAALLLGLGVAGVSFGASAHSSAEASRNDPVTCEIRATRSGGTVTLQGIVQTKASATGSYQLRVTGSGGGGSSNIQQGGEFRADRHGAAVLGQVMLGGSGTSYDARLHVTSGGVTVDCRERIRTVI